MAATPVSGPATPAVLPFGTTLHHAGCGCPPGWELGLCGPAPGEPQYRPADLVDFLLHRSFRNFQQGGVTPMRKLRVAYMLPHHNITGGMKCLVEHIRLLRVRGHRTIAVHRSDTAVRAMPPWTKEEADVDVVCRLHQRLADVYPASDIDVCVVGIFHQVAELLMGVPAPVIYWEQGHEWVFGDPIRLQEAHNYRKQDQLFHMVMHLPCALAAVSEAVQAILTSEFGRQPLIIPNGVDCHRFTPGPRSRLPPTSTMACMPGGQELAAPPRREGEKSVLLVGNPALPLKGFDVALAALSAVNRVLPLRVTWVCQTAPQPAHLPILPACGLTLDLHVSPAQEDLAELYRGHDAFIFTSRYEAWGMPVMEAMASGLAVVATRCLGVATFAQHAQNCLLADPQDVLGLAQSLLRVLTDEKLRARLALAARHTALRYTPEAIADRLEAVLYSLTAVSGEVLALRHPALGPLQHAAAWASTACAKAPPPPHPAPQQQQQQPLADGNEQAQEQQQQQQPQPADSKQAQQQHQSAGGHHDLKQPPQQRQQQDSHEVHRHLRDAQHQPSGQQGAQPVGNGDQELTQQQLSQGAKQQAAPAPSLAKQNASALQPDGAHAAGKAPAMA